MFVLLTDYTLRKIMSANDQGIVAVTGRAHCQRQVAFFHMKVSSTTDVLQREEEADKDSMLMQLLTHPPLNAQQDTAPPAQQENRQTGEDYIPFISPEEYSVRCQMLLSDIIAIL